MGVNGMYLLNAGVLEADKSFLHVRVGMGKNNSTFSHDGSIEDG